MVPLNPLSINHLSISPLTQGIRQSSKSAASPQEKPFSVVEHRLQRPITSQASPQQFERLPNANLSSYGAAAYQQVALQSQREAVMAQIGFDYYV